MKRILASLFLIICIGWSASHGQSKSDIPNDWIDSDTSHRVIRLSRQAGRNNSLYFHQNPYTQSGDKMIFAGAPARKRRIFTVDLRSLEIEQVTHRDGKGAVVALKRREVFFLSGDVVFATHLDAHNTRKVATLPQGWSKGSGLTINSDETLLAGSFAIGTDEFFNRPRSEWFNAIQKAKLPNSLYTVEIETGEYKVFHQEDNWLGHIQFSPTDPTLLMYCHEGPWGVVDRIWTIRTDGTERHKIRQRTLEAEIYGHEFWAPDGKTIWFDLQMPRGKSFYLAGFNLESGQETCYPLTRNQWSVHYNISPSGNLFCGDGGCSKSVAHAKDGHWIYLFRPSGKKLKVERLCSLADHNYALEPNVRFSPDEKWVIFRSNMKGIDNVYAVEVAKTDVVSHWPSGGSPIPRKRK